jgi:arylsulfatase A-like enzyme
MRRSGIFEGSWIEAERPTIATLLARQDCQTACIGKWHLGMGENEKNTGPEGLLTASAVTLRTFPSMLI